MSDSIARLRRQIGTANDLQSVVRTMKAMAASSVEQYEQSVQALADYSRTVELGLSACFRELPAGTGAIDETRHREPKTIRAIVFGSDQGLVGRFNDEIADKVLDTLATLPGTHKVWAVGERVQARLSDAGVRLQGLFKVPNSVRTVATLVGEIQWNCVAPEGPEEEGSVYVFHNRPLSAANYEPVCQLMLPLDIQWRRRLTESPWPTKNLPEVMGNSRTTLRPLIREYLFITLFRACVESLASENANRLASMQRADKNIDELLETLNSSSHRMRQSGIDEELFDVISGFEALISP